MLVRHTFAVCFALVIGAENAHAQRDMYRESFPALSAVAAAWQPANTDTVSFRGARWHKVGMATTVATWNNLAVTRPARIARAAEGEVIAALRVVMPKLPPGAHGVVIDLFIMHADAVRRSVPLPDATRWYIPADAYKHLADADITMGDFYKRCFVLLNDSRVDVELSAQK